MDLTLGTWAADGLLALFFLVAGAVGVVEGSSSGSASACSWDLCLARFTEASLNRHYKRVEIEETHDDDADGAPDVYSKRDPAIGS